MTGDFVESMNKEKLLELLTEIADTAVHIENRYGDQRNLNDTSLTLKLVSLFRSLDYYEALLITEKHLISMNKRKISAKGYVYVISFEDGTVKIGKSIDPKSRIKSIAGGDKSKIIDSFTVRCTNMNSLELDAHNHFKSSRLGGEWFNADFYEVVNYLKGFKMKFTEDDLLENIKVGYNFIDRIKNKELSKIGKNILRNHSLGGFIVDGYDPDKNIAYDVQLYPYNDCDDLKYFQNSCSNAMGCKFVSIFSKEKHPSFLD